MKTVTVMIFLSLTLFANITAPSFDCKKANSKIEKMICSDDNLSKIDVEMYTQYKKLRDRLDKKMKKKLLKEQRVWLKSRAKCKDVDCILKSYYKRVDTLKHWYYANRIKGDNFAGEYLYFGSIYAELKITKKRKDTYQYTLTVVGGNNHLCVIEEPKEILLKDNILTDLPITIENKSNKLIIHDKDGEFAKEGCGANMWVDGIDFLFKN